MIAFSMQSKLMSNKYWTIEQRFKSIHLILISSRENLFENQWNHWRFKCGLIGLCNLNVNESRKYDNSRFNQLNGERKKYNGMYPCNRWLRDDWERDEPSREKHFFFGWNSDYVRKYNGLKHVTTLSTYSHISF